MCFDNCSPTLEEPTVLILRVMSPVKSLKTLEVKAGHYFEIPGGGKKLPKHTAQKPGRVASCKIVRFRPQVSTIVKLIVTSWIFVKLLQFINQRM